MAQFNASVRSGECDHLSVYGNMPAVLDQCPMFRSGGTAG